ncbi:type IV pili methyl-accepting chemotaxis transducer N-terminal domain-containing protein [Aquabacterium sp. A7-Y]|uniref:type IV pili methyl-accepting chemotaxis transducer N-terminal domain-containing protein n=1 Tax=Aquabacterium sp. A7-Y TaxID=1349605 RepID=UPI00223D359F|nr:type IV pili methyl-accepting chemotaxis transducer N-terminal domain-containing protein [Aquabacterium sp. A7-Y]MCW7537565.1 type IV pili methyl-accepting chemotaxis transducer N-terminal domain-containing protein [Aquabacterium sp. A7-Y]
MTSVLLVCAEEAGVAALRADLDGAGIHVLGAVDRRNVVREAVRHAPDLLVWLEPAPDDMMLETLALLAATAPLPVLVFTSDCDAERMERALEAGVSAWVVDGYAAARLRPLLQLARARFHREQQLKAALEDVTHRFEERKLVDRAKGILMRATQVSEDEAFRVLRTVSMRDNLRVGQVSRQLIDVARYAEGVNRAGQLRMLSQRAVKLYALQATGTETQGSRALLAESCTRVESNLQALGRELSKATFGDLLEAVQSVWQELKQRLSAPAVPAQLGALDALAERLLSGAERLTGVLENAGHLNTLHIINVCGRQRMLSQRLAKQALLGQALDGEAGEAARARARETVQQFEQSLGWLNAAPLTTPDIRALLEAAGRNWQDLLGGVRQAGQAEGRLALAAASEALLELFDRLTERYERSIQALTR